MRRILKLQSRVRRHIPLPIRRLLPAPLRNYVRNRIRPAIQGHIETPLPGATVEEGRMVFGGWALLNGMATRRVELVINHSTRVEAKTGLPRPEVPPHIGQLDADPNCGWAANVDLSQLEPGDLLVEAWIEGTGGEPQLLGQSMCHLRGFALQGTIDPSEPFKEIEGELLVLRGWAQMRGGVARIEVAVDGKVVGRARLGLPRPEILNLNPSYSPAAGYEFRGVVPTLLDGEEHEATVIVTNLKGHSDQLDPVRIHLRPPQLTEPEKRHLSVLRENTQAALAFASRTDVQGRRLLVFAHSLSIGGGELYLQDLLKQLIPALDYCLVVCPTDGALRSELEDMGAEVIITGLSQPLDPNTYEGHVRLYSHLINDSGCDIALLNTVGQYVALDAAQRMGIKTIWAIHESFELTDWLDLNSGGAIVSPYLSERLCVALQEASVLVFESKATRDMYVTAGAPHTRTRVQPYGVDMDALDSFAKSFSPQEMRDRNDIAADDFVFLCVGVFQERKTQAVLIEAFSRVSGAHPGALLVLVGDHPAPYSDLLHDLGDKLGSKRIRYIPITPDIWSWYGIADVLVSASDAESLPRSMIEAMALKCPVLSVSVFGVPELITDDSNGWLVQPRDAAALVCGMQRVLHLPREHRLRVGAQARQSVERRYRGDVYGAAYARIIDELSSEASKSLASPLATSSRA